jgi:NAD(P)H-hydrate epimerase
MKVLTAEQMREVDRLTTEHYRIPSLILMENAAARTAEAVEQTYGPMADKYVKVICGRGNNGGDGAGIARQLWMRGAIVDVLLLGRVDETTGDARVNFEVVRALSETGSGLGFREILTSDDLWDEGIADEADICIDALFGTGLTRAVDGLFAEAIELINEHIEAPVVAVDLPSGLASDSGNLLGPFVRANLTVTFTAPKPACVLPPACFACGLLATAAIGSPEELVEEAGPWLHLLTPELVSERLLRTSRPRDAHKGDAGAVLLVAGGAGKTGAAALAAEGALRSGAGLVTVAVGAADEPTLAARCVSEVMTEPLENADGGIAGSAASVVARLCERRDVIAIGPGLGTAEGTRRAVREMIEKRRLPTVVDADGLNCMAPWPDSIVGSQELPIVVTPHPAEMARIAGTTLADVLADRVAAARSFATTHSVVTVLKGARTLIAGPDGTVYVNPTGNAGMATGGSGDVLTGVLATFLAQMPGDPLDAALTAVYVHGLAGDLAAREIGVRALVASDISKHLGKAFQELGEGDSGA